MRHYPALDIAWPAAPSEADTDLLLAAIDDAGPVAVEEHGHGLRVYFSSAEDRDAASAAVAAFDRQLVVTAQSISDENWAERSQAALTPITVGRVTVAPPWAPAAAAGGESITLVIEPSMGFGTGHHASTRLCLALLQRRPRHGQAVLDVGTGSGVLALAAWRLGAASALGIDVDPDAITAATDSVARNEAGAQVTLAVSDLTRDGGALAGRFDLTFANLTGGLLRRTAPALVATLTTRGELIASGFQVDERADVLAALASAGARLVDEATEDGWVGVAVCGTLP